MYTLVIFLMLFSGNTSGGAFGAIKEIPAFQTKEVCEAARHQIETDTTIKWFNHASLVLTSCVKKSK